MAKSKGKIGVLLVNLGTPDSPETGDVRKYLREFLMDGRVIDFPLVHRWMLVNLIIAPFRAPKSAKEYKKLWTERGSPLLYHGVDVKHLLQEQLGEEYLVTLAMRYQTPSIADGLEELRKANVSRIICIPLFPQYASATSGSVVEKVMEITSTWQTIPSINFVNNFVEEPLFIETIAAQAREQMKDQTYDHYLFSYHGVPERQIRKGSCDGYCQLSEKCCATYNKKNQLCYRAQCFHTSRQVAAKLGLSDDQYTVCFQSRLGTDPWVQPYTDDVVEHLAEKGVKKILAFSPAFVADCLETTLEVGEEYRELFMEEGGEQWDLVDSLNSHPLWISCLKEIVEKN